jgi:hypothetical protein
MRHLLILGSVVLAGVTTTPTGTLTELAPMGAARAAHSMTLLATGDVLVVGGMSGSESQLSGAERFDHRTRRFVPIAGEAARRQSHSATRLPDGRVLIAGGMDASARYLDTTLLYDPRTGTFTSSGRLSAPRSNHEAVLLDDGRVLLVGGVGTGWSFLASAEIYDPRTGVSTATGSMTGPRESHVAVKMADGRVLVAGGHRGRRTAITIFDSSEIFDPSTGRFTASGVMTIRRHKHDAVALPDGRVMILGGADERDNEGAYRSTEFFDPATGRFSNGPTLQLARYKLSGTTQLLDAHTLLLTSGATRAEELDLTTGRSTLVDGTARMAGQFAAAVMLGDGRVLITGGYGEGSGPRNSAWIYRPGQSRGDTGR